jgi:hypothetical protein
VPRDFSRIDSPVQFDILQRLLGGSGHENHTLVYDIANYRDTTQSAMGRTSLSNFSIAQRMSWAAHRKTTRVEDIAYCLMGLFGVNMPMLYGEGDRAFIRLQEEIMRIFDDDSIFAWKAYLGMGSDIGLLAHSPSAFEGSGNVVGCIYEDTKPFTLTNKGIRIQMRARVLAENDLCTWMVVLNCEVNSKSIGLCLKRTSSIENQWLRDRSEIWIVVEKTDRHQFSFPELYVKANRTVNLNQGLGLVVSG